MDIYDEADGHITYIYTNEDSGEKIPYVMNEMAANEVNSIASNILDVLDDIRSGTGDPLAAIESMCHFLLAIAGPV